MPITEWLIEELNIKYLIPTKIGRAWVKADRLLFLLDGLDEVRAESQAICVTAINAFRQEHGLVPIAVSSRADDYLAIPEKLRLGGAIQLLPLDSRQAERYLQENVGSQSGLANILERDSRLANLAQSPLMLNIMALTFQDIRTDAVLRILLRFEGSIPPRYTNFLEHAVDLIFLRRVGGGYIFVHQLLHNYFARHKKI